MVSDNAKIQLDLVSFTSKISRIVINMIWQIHLS